MFCALPALLELVSLPAWAILQINGLFGRGFFSIYNPLHYFGRESCYVWSLNCLSFVTNRLAPQTSHAGLQSASQALIYWYVIICQLWRHFLLNVNYVKRRCLCDITLIWISAEPHCSVNSISISLYPTLGVYIIDTLYMFCKLILNVHSQASFYNRTMKWCPPF